MSDLISQLETYRKGKERKLFIIILILLLMAIILFILTLFIMMKSTQIETMTNILIALALPLVSLLILTPALYYRHKRQFNLYVDIQVERIIRTDFPFIDVVDHKNGLTYNDVLASKLLSIERLSFSSRKLVTGQYRGCEFKSSKVNFGFNNDDELSLHTGIFRGAWIKIALFEEVKSFIKVYNGKAFFLTNNFGLKKHRPNGEAIASDVFVYTKKKENRNDILSKEMIQLLNSLAQEYDSFMMVFRNNKIHLALNYHDEEKDSNPVKNLIVSTSKEMSVIKEIIDNENNRK